MTSFAFWAGLAIGAGCGGAAIWFGKEWILSFVLGTEAVIAKLQAKIDTIKKA